MLTLIDGNSLLFRAYYGMHSRLSRTDGSPTGAVYGFCSMILPLLAKAGPDDVFACVFDASRKTFRNEIYPEYKANRQDTPPDLLAQTELTRDAVRAMGIPVLAIAGVEADDVIATIAKKFCGYIGGTRIITSDKDLMQLVDDCVFLYDGMKEREVREPDVLEKFGVLPTQVIDVQSLMGDSSDNVPGVPGIGPKKAAELINQFGNLDSIYENINQVQNDRIRNLLIDNKEKAYISKKLVTLKTDVDISELKLCPFVFDTEKAAEFAKNEIESPALVARMQKLFPVIEKKSFDNTDLFEQKTNVQIINPAYKIIMTENELTEFLGTVKNILVFDTETTSLNQMNAKLVGISMAADSNMGVYIPIRHGMQSNDLFGDENNSEPKQLSIDFIKKTLWPYLTNPNIIKVGHNLKYDLHVLANEGWDSYVITPIDDTMLMSYALHGSLHLHNLDELAKLYLGHENITYESLFDAKDKEKRFDGLDINTAAPYAAEDSYICFALYEKFHNLIEKNEKLKRLYNTCDLPLLKILLKIERNGVLADRQKLYRLSETFHLQLENLEKEIWDMAGHEFNIASPKQLATILFDEMGLLSNKKRSTDADTLSELAESHPIVDKILQWRSIAKLAGTYADALPRQIASDGRIHTSYLQTSTSTGRLSSRDPNLQNIPIKTQLGEQIRSCFIAPAGHKLISVDYSQIQLRLLADVADIKLFKDTFDNNLDIHEQTARKIFKIPNNESVSKDMRRAAKTINFSIIYGISSFGLATQLNISRTDAQQIINSYMDELPEVKEYMENIKEFATENACVYTPWGRRIELPDAKNPRLRAYAMRAAINAPIQGFEADIMRLALINIDKNIIQNNKNIKMIMQVHDEIVLECDSDSALEFATKIKQEMESVVKISVPLSAEFCIGDNWGK